MNSAQTIRLVALREIQTRVRERSFHLSIAFTLLMIAGITVLPALLDSDDGRARIAATDARAARLAEAAAQIRMRDGDGIVVERMSPQAARRSLAGDRVVAVASAERVTFREDPSDSLVLALEQADRRLKSEQALERAGLAPSERAAVLTPEPLAVEVLEPSDARAEARAGMAFIVVLLLYVQLLTFGYFVASGVVEEKASRVVELLLAAIRPRDLLAGKVLGIGLLGLVQLTAIAAVGLASASMTDTLAIDSDLLSAVWLAVAWFILGYAFYATLFACAGALVPRQEELQSTTMPLTLIIVVGAFLSFNVLEDPDGTLARVSAFIPPLAPMTLPARIALGEARAIEIAGGIVVTILATAALVPLAARIYSGGLLGTRTRVGLSQAWRGTRR